MDNAQEILLEAAGTVVNHPHQSAKNPFDGEWGDIIPLPRELRPVEKFHPDLLPKPLSSWAINAAHRMDDMPLDFFGVGIIVAVGAMIGARLAIHPKRNDDWAVVPNLWGAGIGRPATKKTPSFKEAMRFSRAIEANAYEAYQIDLSQFEVSKEADKIFRDTKVSGLKKNKSLTKSELMDSLMVLDSTSEDEPARARYIVNDPTVEKLGELLRSNPMGLLLFRDELSGWLSSLDREDRQQDRAFYLEGWSGTGDFSVDRIGRGEVYIPRVVISVLGGIQPSKIAPYLHSMSSGKADDGLLQRFQLMVWPDVKTPKHVDESPDMEILAKARNIFRRASELPPPENGNHFTLHFDDQAQDAFDQWYSEMLVRELAEDNHHMESHLVKYHSLLPSLALIFHVIEDRPEAKVGIDAVDRAMAWLRYLETHARRVYGLLDDPYYGASQLIRKLDKLPNPFSKSDFNRKGWSGLTNAPEINAALEQLIAHNVLKRQEVKTATKPAILYHINPDVMADDE